MKLIVVLFLGVVLSVALAEPLRYRQGQQIRASARQTDGGVALQAELGDPTTEANVSQADDGKSEVTPQAPPVIQTAPYYPKGWRPLGQLLVLPFAIRENLESTTTVESSTFNEAETTEEPSTTETIAAKEAQLEVETSEPQAKKTAAYKKPPFKLVGELKVESKEESNENSKDSSEDSSESSETDSTTTETNDEATTESKSADLETTSEPQSEAVDAENSNEEGQQSTNTQQENQPQVPLAPQAPQAPQAAFFVQLPDGTLQRIVYFAPQTPAQAVPAQAVPTQAVFMPQAANVQFQQLNQQPNYPFGFNPITNPRIVTFSSQYQV